MLAIDRIDLVAAQTIPSGTSRTSQALTGLSGNGIVAIYGRVQNIASAAGGGAGRTIATLTPAIELEDGGGYTNLSTASAVQGCAFDATGVQAVNIDKWGRFTIFPNPDTRGVFPSLQELDIASLKFTFGTASADMVINCRLWLRRFVVQYQPQTYPLTGAWG